MAYTTRFVIHEGEDGQWYWRLVRGNGEPVCSSEGYTRKMDAVRAAFDMPAWAAVATFDIQD